MTWPASLPATFDWLLAAALLWTAWQALAAPRLDRAIIMFISFGLLLALAWARLEAPDIGLAEAAIGAGLTGALLLDTFGVMHRATSRRARGRMQPLLTAAVLALAAGGGIVGVLALGPVADRTAALVSLRLAESGVSHPVTAVLLNFRGYDTLLEVAVLLLAVLGILAVGGTGAPARTAPDAVLRTVARIAVPNMIVVAVYLLWAGAFRPGGAFQAGAVLAAAAVLLRLADLCGGWRAPGPGWRVALAGGFVLFLAIAAATLSQGALLRYPPAHAGALILAIETGLTVSLAAILAGLYLFLAPPPDAPR